MNTYSKGNRRERECMNILIADGWLVDRKNRTKFQSNDFFEMFDIVALRGNTVKFIQVKSNISHFYSARKSIKKWVKNNKVSVPCELWLKENYKPWRIEILNPDEKKED